MIVRSGTPRHTAANIALARAGSLASKIDKPCPFDRFFPATNSTLSDIAAANFKSPSGEPGCISSSLNLSQYSARFFKEVEFSITIFTPLCPLSPDSSPHNAPMPNLSQNTKLFLTLALQAAAIVWWASKLQSSVQHNDFQIQMLERTVTKNAEFVEKWPAGKWGSGELPSDTKQDLFIAELVKRVEKLYDDLYELKPDRD